MGPKIWGPNQGSLAMNPYIWYFSYILALSSFAIKAQASKNWQLVGHDSWKFAPAQPSSKNDLIIEKKVAVSRV